MASSSLHKSKKRCNNSLSSPLHPIQKKQQCSSVSSSFEESFEERDSGLDTFIGDECSVLETDTSPKSRRDSEGFQDLLCAEEDLSDNPVVIKMGRSRNSINDRVRHSASKENRRDVLRVSLGTRKGNYVMGQSLTAKSVDIPFHEMPDPDGHFRIRPNVAALRARPRCRPDVFDSREKACPFLDKDKWSGYQRVAHVFGMHPDLEPYMRSMLLEWMMEVSKAHSLQRKTYQMAMDFVDRFLSYTENVPKNILQLLGIAALSIAAKIEEIFPPKLSEMAYVTDEAHDVYDIKAMEKLMLNVLGTAFMPVTTCEWVGVFLFNDERPGLQTHSRLRTVKRNLSEPSLETFARACRLTDLAMLDHVCLNYSYRHLAAAAIYSLGADEQVIQALNESLVAEMDSVVACMRWIRLYADIEGLLPPLTAVSSSRNPEQELTWPHLQSHDFDLEVFLQALSMQQQRSPLSEQNENMEQLSLIDWEDVEEEIEVTAVKTPQRAHLSSAFYTPPDSQTKSRCRYE